MKYDTVMGALARERQRQKLGHDGPPTPGAGGFGILLLPFYGPPLALWLYPLATLAMFAVGFTLDNIRTATGWSTDGVPIVQWIVMFAVFFVVFRIDNRLGLTQPYYFIRHIVRTLIAAAAFNWVGLRETTGEPETIAAFFTPLFTDLGHLFRILVMVALSQWFLRSYWTRTGWNIALTTWRLRPRDYRPHFMPGEGGFLPFTENSGAHKPDKVAKKEVPELLQQVCSWGRIYTTGNVSFDTLIAAAGGPGRVLQLKPADLIRGYNDRPEDIEAWTTYFEAHPNAQWFVRKTETGWQAGEKGGQVKSFTDGAEACAHFMCSFLAAACGAPK